MTQIHPVMVFTGLITHHTAANVQEVKEEGWKGPSQDCYHDTMGYCFFRPSRPIYCQDEETKRYRLK